MVQVMEVRGSLGESIIPAVPGEYYSYSSEFTEERPIYVLMKCKANKARSIADAEELGREANLLFQFDSPTQARVCSIKKACASGLLEGPIGQELFGETWIAPVRITHKAFQELRSRKDVATMVQVCQAACSKHEVTAVLNQGSIIAMTTDGGKYGIFLVKDLDTRSLQIDACHILL